MTTILSRVHLFFTCLALTTCLSMAPLSSQAEDEDPDPAPGTKSVSTPSEEPSTDTNADARQGAAPQEEPEDNVGTTPPATTPPKIAGPGRESYFDFLHPARKATSNFWKAFGAFMGEMYAMESDEIEEESRTQARQEHAVTAAQSVKWYMSDVSRRCGVWASLANATGHQWFAVAVTKYGEWKSSKQKKA